MTGATAKTLHVSGKIAPDQTQSHIEHPFDVPVGTTRIEIDFEYAPVDLGEDRLPNQISLSLYDPKKGRGARHNNADQRIVLREDYASKGYIPRPLYSGSWVVSIDIHRITPPDEVRYELSIELDSAPQPPPPPPHQPSSCAPRGPGRYRGDLHGHTLHSDAVWEVPEFVEYARAIGLDFVTLTDHNTTSGITECLSLADNNLLVMGGMELTTFRGHCLALGTHDWVEWRTLAERSMSAIATDILNNGALFVIAHPAHVGNPWCTGCDWKYADMMPGVAKVVEVWNSDWSGPSRNEQALALYYSWLNQGHHLVATAGSDVHGPFGVNQRPGYNVVYADALRADKILDAVSKGRLYLSSGPELIVTCAGRPEVTAIGAAFPTGNVSLLVTWDKCPADASIRLVRRSFRDDSPCETMLAGQGTKGSLEVRFEPRGDFDWATIEVRDSAGALHAVTNPTFFRGSSR